MITSEKIKLIDTRLKSAFHPTQLVISDDSDQHIGHAGHGGGGKHFSIVISSPHFAGKSRVDAHREVYDQLKDLIPHEIHALKIKII